MAAKRPDGFKKSSSSEEFNKNKLNAQASLHKPNTLGYESDTNVVPSPALQANNANLKTTTERKKGTFMRSLARADRDARFPAHEKQRRFENRSVLVFAVRVARVPPARVNSLSIFSSTHVCSYPSLVLDFFSLEKVDFSACRFDFFQRASGLR
jgi:hypothetical protein